MPVAHERIMAWASDGVRMEGMRASWVLLAVGAIVGAGAFGAGYGIHASSVPGPETRTDYHNTTLYENTTEFRNITNYQNVTYYQNTTTYVYPNGTEGPGPDVTDFRTLITFPFPAPCLSYVEALYTGLADTMEFRVNVESGNVQSLQGSVYHRWTNGSYVHDDLILGFDLGTPAGGIINLRASHPGLDWPSTVDMSLACGSGVPSKPVLTFAGVSLSLGNATFAVASVSRALPVTYFRIVLQVSTVTSSPSAIASETSYAALDVGGTIYRVYWQDLGDDGDLNGGDSFRVTGDGVPLLPASFTFYLLWAADGSLIQIKTWQT